MQKLFANEHLILLGDTIKYLRDRVSPQYADFLKGNFVEFYSKTIFDDYLTEIIFLDSSIGYTPTKNITFLPPYDLRNRWWVRLVMTTWRS